MSKQEVLAAIAQKQIEIEALQAQLSEIEEIEENQATNREASLEIKQLIISDAIPYFYEELNEAELKRFYIYNNLLHTAIYNRTTSCTAFTTESLPTSLI